MKKLALLLTLLITPSLWAQNAQDILGSWMMQESKDGAVSSLIEIFEHEGKFYAYGYAMVDGSSTKDLDVHNKNKELRSRPMRDVIFLYGVSFENGTWGNGEIYRPTDGSYFFVKGKLSDPDTLEWRASVDKAGVFGATQVWKRVPADKSFSSMKTPKDKLLKLVSELKYYRIK
ncbi:MAG: DUF2147 domain-containing protein [Brevinema sp.]